MLKGAVSLSAKYNDIRDACIHLPTPYVTYKASLISVHYRVVLRQEKVPVKLRFLY